MWPGPDHGVRAAAVHEKHERRTVLDSVSGEGNRACIAYDNLPVKGYVYALGEIMEIHDLDTRIPTAGGEAAICPDCGYVLEIPGT